MSDFTNESERLAARLLHFEDEDPKSPNVPFVNTSDALAWLAKMGFNLAEWEGFIGEEWEPTGLIEEKLDVYSGTIQVGQLVRLREICPACKRPDGVEHRRHYDEDGALLGTFTFCSKCEHTWDVNY